MIVQTEFDISLETPDLMCMDLHLDLQLPISPKQREKLNDTFEMLSDNEESATTSDDLKDVYDRLEKQLMKQLEKCKAWRFIYIAKAPEWKYN